MKFAFQFIFIIYLKLYAWFYCNINSIIHNLHHWNLCQSFQLYLRKFLLSILVVRIMRLKAINFLSKRNSCFTTERLKGPLINPDERCIHRELWYFEYESSSSSYLPFIDPSSRKEFSLFFFMDATRMFIRLWIFIKSFSVARRIAGGE